MLIKVSRQPLLLPLDTTNVRNILRVDDINHTHYRLTHLSSGHNVRISSIYVSVRMVS